MITLEKTISEPEKGFIDLIRIDTSPESSKHIERERKLIDTAGAEAYLCVQPDLSKTARITLYVYNQRANIKQLIEGSWEGQSYSFKRLIPSELHEYVILALNPALKQKPVQSEKIGKIFIDRYSFTQEKKAAAYEAMRNFHQAFNK